ncbi:MAG TPA: helix-turn-helix domain-containing protein [Polyangiaceae bacterium]|nr:helix-turn-helix domain-containing protein [Polyangiaceae bacterium]
MTKQRKPFSKLDEDESLPAAVVVTTRSADDPSPTRLLTRNEAAQLLGVSVSTVIRREQTLKPVLVNGVHMFDEAIVRREVTTIRQRHAVASLGPTAGDVAASVFELLEADVEPAQIVIRLKVPPDIVQALRSQWLEMLKGSKCARCGEPRHVLCRACLVDALDVPCPTCSTLCSHCTAPLNKGKSLCKVCGKWSLS